jgi:hypothetical protein
MEQIFTVLISSLAVLAVIGGVVGYFLPRVSRVLGWAVIVGAIPAGFAAHGAFNDYSRSCGEMMAGVCHIVSLSVGIGAAAVVVMLGIGMVIGPALASSGAKKAAAPE